MARIESGNIKPQCEPFLLDELLQELAEEFSASADNSHITFRVVKCHHWGYSDKQLLHRMLQNLIGNAFRYASPGKVMVNVRRRDQKLTIEVRDNGPGIPEDKQKMVFEEFTQLGNEQALTTKGLGLGLNITQGLSQLLGHQLTLSSKEKLGCKFSITLDKVNAVKRPQAKSNAKAPTLTGLTVLCIDDDEDVLSGMVELLSTWGCEVLAADTYESAIELFEQDKFSIDIVLSDYQLDADRNGIELVKQLRSSLNYYLPAVIITATTEANIEQKVTQEDVGYMKKMVKPAALRALISAQLTKKLQDKYLN